MSKAPLPEDAMAETARQMFDRGKVRFEQGRYAEAIAGFEAALGHTERGTRLGGEIQVWLVNALDAVGRADEAKALCQTLCQHPHSTVRHSARYVLGILTAPRLRIPEASRLRFPDLRQLDGEAPPSPAMASAPKRPASKPLTPDAEDVLPPPASARGADLRFLGFALVVAIAILVYGAMR